MLTTSLPLIPEGSNKAHLSMTPPAHRLREADVTPVFQARGLYPRDYERTCTDDGCDLTASPAQTAP